MSEKSQHILRRIEHRLRMAWQRMTFEQLLRGLAVVITAVLGLLGLFLALEMRFWLDEAWRSSLFWVWLAGSILLLTWYVFIPLIRGWLARERYKDIARHLSGHAPELQDRLVNLLELSRGEASAAPQPLVDGAVEKLGQEVEQLPIEQAVSVRGALRRTRIAAIPAAAVLVLVLAAPSSFMGASVRLFSPGVTFERPAPFVLEAEPGSVEITRGDSLEVTVHAAGSELPDEVSLEIIRADEESVQSTPLGLGTDHRANHVEPNIRHNLRYRFVAGSVATAWYNVTVLDRPVLRNLQIDLHPPAYTRLPPRSLPLGTGNIVALRGTEAHISVRTSVEDALAWLEFDGNNPDVQLTDWSGSFQVRTADTYRIILESPDGVRNTDPVTHTITPIDDQYPTIELVSPDPSADLDMSLITPLVARMSDDYGFTKLSLFWRLAESRFGDTMPEFEELILDLPPLGNLQYVWDVGTSTGLDIVPGDVVTYYLTVWDNDAFGGFKAASSATHQLRLPSLAERYETLETVQDSNEGELE